MSDLDVVAVARVVGGVARPRTPRGSELDRPMEMVVGALAACSAETLHAILARMRYRVHDHRVVVSGLRAERAPTVWRVLRVEHRVRCPAPSDRLQHAIRLVQRTCPVSVMLAATVDLETTLVQVCRVDPEATRPLRQRVLRPHQTIEEMVVPGETDPDAGFYAALADGEVVATGFVMPAQPIPDQLDDGDTWRVRGMSADPDRRGSGLGTMVLAELIAHARTHGAARVWASVRLPARSLYERFGFVPVSEVYELEQIGPHIRMALDVD